MKINDAQKISDLNLAQERYANGSTFLHFAARRGYNQMESLLIKAGADVNAKDESGGTPLGLAASFKNKDGVSLLIEAGADEVSSFHPEIQSFIKEKFAYKKFDQILEKHQEVKLHEAIKLESQDDINIRPSPKNVSRSRPRSLSI